MAIRLLLADDHPLILDGLENLFSLEEDLQVVGRCSNGSEVIEAVRQHLPDVLVLDIRMPGKSGLDIAREIRREKLTTRIVLLTAALDEEELMSAVRVGVHGIVLKEMAPQLLLECIRKVHGGEKWLENRTAKQALESMLRRESGAIELNTLLTTREIEIVRMVAAGLRNKEIGNKLFISEGTVKIHLHNIYEKLNVEGRVGLLRFAQEKGIVF